MSRSSDSGTGKTLRKLIDDAHAFIDWAKGLGIQIHKNNNWVERAVQRTEQILAEKDDKKRRQEFDRFYSDPVEAQNNASDLSHLSEMHKYIGVQSEEILHDKVAKAIGGVDSVRQETRNNTESRDARFELSTCARLNQRGFTAKLCEPNPDIMARRKKVRAAIECKRVYSENSLEKQVLKGAKQLRDRPGNKDTDLRVVFCDVTRAFTGGRLHLHGKRDEVIRELEQKLEELGHEVMDLLVKKYITDVDAVVLCYQDYIEVVDDTYVLVSITQNLVVINPMPPRKQRRLARFFLAKLDPKGKVHHKDIFS